MSDRWGSGGDAAFLGGLAHSGFAGRVAGVAATLEATTGPAPFARLRDAWLADPAYRQRARWFYLDPGRLRFVEGATRRVTALRIIAPSGIFAAKRKE